MENSNEEVKPEVPEVPVTPEEQPIETVEDKVQEDPLKDLVSVQAAQYRYLEKLDEHIFSDGEVEVSELQNIEFCKSQIVMQVVSMESYAAGLSANDPRRKTVDAVLAHLYKSYKKTEDMRNRAVSGRFRTEYRKDVAEAIYGDSYTGSHHRNQVVTDDMLMPNNKQLSLNLMNTTGLGVAAGALSFVKDFINNPEECLKAQKDDLIAEFVAKATPEEKVFSNQWSEALISQLAPVKDVKMISNLLEGKTNLGSVIQYQLSGLSSVLSA